MNPYPSFTREWRFRSAFEEERGRNNISRTAITAAVSHAADQLGGRLYVSKKRTPLVILRFRNRASTLCFFARSETWRWFYPAFEYVKDQDKIDFTSVADFMLFYEAERDRKEIRTFVVYGDLADGRTQFSRATLIAGR